MRKQVEVLKGAVVLTAQERPEGLGKAFREDLFKKLASADGIFGRMPYQILTKVRHCNNTHVQPDRSSLTISTHCYDG